MIDVSGLFEPVDQDLVRRLHDRHLGAEALEQLRELDADRPSAENDQRMRRDGAQKVLEVESGDGTTTLSADEIIVASGGRGNIEGLALDHAGVSTEKSYVVADRYLRTTASRIWACGDVHGKLQFTHVAAHEATKLVRNMLFPGRTA